MSAAAVVHPCNDCLRGPRAAVRHTDPDPAWSPP